MQAETLHCPNCGAAASSDASQCQFCGSRLATVACASCFGMMFIGSKHCPRCGAAAVARQNVANVQQRCPRCGIEMQTVSLGPTTVQECDKCLGLWLDVASFESICADRERQAAVLGSASVAPSNVMRGTNQVKYVPCPTCSQLMNRINFARCSGVIVDVCKGHGTWFDREELSRIIEFIRAGGLESSRAREKEEIKQERMRLLEQQRLAATEPLPFFREAEERRKTGISAARGLLKFLLD
jgi:Zn-finger nucleic acid-binding protein